jgi:hypothetical protein
MPKEIFVEWEGPLSYDEAIKYYFDNESRSDYGLYQIYGPHPIYSNKKRKSDDDILLYIGQTTSGGKFSERIKSQGFCNGPGYKIYFGRIDPEHKIDDNIWRLYVLDAEKILINKYTPPYNAQYVGDLTNNQLNIQDSVIINLGKDIGDLDKEVRSEEVVYTSTS